jgi:hypothetical protein
MYFARQVRELEAVVAFEKSGGHVKFDHDWALRDIRARRRLLEVQTIKAASEALLSTSMATKFLRRTSRTARPFPDSYLAADTIAVDLAAKSMLVAYARELLQLELRAVGSPLPLTRMIAPGFGILANSVEAVAQGSAIFLQEGRELWQVMLRGLPAFSQTYREKMNPDASEEDIASELFVPIVLIPDWPTRFKELRHERPLREGCSEQDTPKESNTLSARTHRGMGQEALGGAGVAVARDHTLRPTAKCKPSEDQILDDIRAALISSD